MSGRIVLVAMVAMIAFSLVFTGNGWAQAQKKPADLHNVKKFQKPEQKRELKPIDRAQRRLPKFITIDVNVSPERYCCEGGPCGERPLRVKVNTAARATVTMKFYRKEYGSSSYELVKTVRKTSNRSGSCAYNTTTENPAFCPMGDYKLVVTVSKEGQPTSRTTTHFDSVLG